MQLTPKSTSSFALPLIAVATLTAIWLGPKWLPFVLLGLGAVWVGVAKPARPMISLAGIGALLVASLLSFGFGVGADMAARDNARAEVGR